MACSPSTRRRIRWVLGSFSPALWDLPDRAVDRERGPLPVDVAPPQTTHLAPAHPVIAAKVIMVASPGCGMPPLRRSRSGLARVEEPAWPCGSLGAGWRSELRWPATSSPGVSSMPARRLASASRRARALSQTVQVEWNLPRPDFAGRSLDMASPRWRPRAWLPLTEIEYHTAACSGSTNTISSTVKPDEDRVLPPDRSHGRPDHDTWSTTGVRGRPLIESVTLAKLGSKVSRSSPKTGDDETAPHAEASCH